MEQDETDPVFLTYDELQTLMKKKFTIPRLELVRDILDVYKRQHMYTATASTTS